MTISTAALVERRRRKPAATSLAGDLAASFLAAAAASSVLTWPSPRYERDPVGFARDVLGAQLYPQQQEILEALAAPNARVSVASGHRCGKDYIGSLAACWFFCTFPGARVQLTAPTAKQIQGVTWREIRLRVREARTEIASPDQIGELPSTGIVAADLREIKGYTAKKGEAVTGFAAPHILYVITEASGIDDPIWEAIRGNLAGSDARVLLISNPTKRRGFFYDSHHRNKAQWTTRQLSSWDIAREHERSGGRVGGLATVRWCEEMRVSYGEDDPRYKVRVLGQFVELGEDKVFPLDLVTDAQTRWEETVVLPSDTLHFGVDPAQGGRDEIGVVGRRGRKLLAPYRFRESDADRAAEVVMQQIDTERGPREPVVIKVDNGGEGWRLRVALERLARKRDPSGDLIQVIRIDFGWSPRRPESYLRLRDELFFTARDWLREGGAIPADAKLEQDLLEPKFTEDLKHRLVVESKDKIRERIGRSTDTGDAALLAIWPFGEVKNWGPAPAPQRDDAPAAEGGDVYDAPGTFDAYSGLDAWRGGR